jgi:hypothetical protein
MEGEVRACFCRQRRIGIADLRKETPTIAEFFKKNGYATYFSGKWHLGDKPESYPIEHGFDEMKNFAAYYAGVYTYDYTNKWFHPWFPSYNPQFAKYFSENVNLAEWEGAAGQPAKNLGTITYERFATFDEDQAANAVNYIKQHANGDKPFFMDVNFLKMHNPTNAAPDFAGKSLLGNYSDSLMELDADIGKVMDELRKDAPNTLVIVTADNGAWLDAYPDAGTTPFRGEKGSPFEGGWRVPGIMWWPQHIQAGAHFDEMMSHIDAWATLASMVGLTPPPHEWVGNDGKPIYFDSIDNSAYILGKAQHSARTSWVYIDGETFNGARADIGGDPTEPWVHIAWKYLYTAKDSWLGVEANLGAIGAAYNLTMDPSGPGPFTVFAPSNAAFTRPPCLNAGLSEQPAPSEQVACRGPVDPDGLAGNEAGPIGAQERHYSRHFIGAANAAHRVNLGKGVSGQAMRGDIVVGQIRGERPGGDGVAGDVVTAIFIGHRLHHGGGGDADVLVILRVLQMGRFHAHRAQRHNASPALQLHRRNDFLQEAHQRQHIIFIGQHIF